MRNSLFLVLLSSTVLSAQVTGGSGGNSGSNAITIQPGASIGKATAATAQDEIVFLTNESGAGNFRIGIGSTLNSFGSGRYDQVLTWGYNHVPGAGTILLGTEPAMAWRMENHFEPSMGVVAMENHLVYINSSNTSYRILATYTDTSTDSTLLSWNVDNYQIFAKDQTTQLLYINTVTTPEIRVMGATAHFQYNTNNAQWFRQEVAANNGFATLVYLDSNDMLTLGGTSTQGVKFGVPINVNGIAATPTDAFLIQNTTASTSGVPVQEPPRIRFNSHVWNTTTPADNTDGWSIYPIPTSGATPSSVLAFFSNLNGAGDTNKWQVSSAGATLQAGAITVGGNLKFTSNGSLQVGGDGLFKLTDNPTTSGTGLDVKTNGIIKVKNTAFNAFATVQLGELDIAGNLLCSQTAPTVSGFGTSPSVPANNGNCAFTINVGTGGSASTGTITLPTATTGWVVSCYDVTTPASFITNQTGGSTTTATVTNYSRTTGSAIAWTASDVLRCSAVAY